MSDSDGSQVEQAVFCAVLSAALARSSGRLTPRRKTVRVMPALPAIAEDDIRPRIKAI